MRSLFLFLVSICISVGAIELYLTFDNSLIGDGYVYRFPKTEIRTEILVERKLIPKQKNQKVAKIKGTNLPYVSATLSRPSHEADSALGAVDYFYYEDGFCNVDIDRDNLKVLAIGDSFTYCTSVAPDAAWPIQIDFYNIPSDRKYNLGIPGAGPFDYVEVTRAKITNETELVIVALYEGNDLRDSIIYAESDDTDIEQPSDVEMGVRRLGNYFILPNLIWAALNETTIVAMPYNFSYRFKNSAISMEFNLRNVDNDEVDHGFGIISGAIPPTRIEKLWREPFREIWEITQEHGSKLLFLYLPSAYTYLPSAYTAFGDKALFSDKEVENAVRTLSRTQQDVFEKICKDLEVDCVNTVPAFIAYNEDSTKPSHFPVNLHLSNEGHSLVAQIASKKIREMFSQ